MGSGRRLSETAFKICQENKEGSYWCVSSNQKYEEDAGLLLNGVGKLGDKWHGKC